MTPLTRLPCRAQSRSSLYRSTHAGVFRRIDDHFGIGIPDARPVTPYSDHDWEGVGVQPDVPVHAADALATAEKLAEHQLRHR